MPSMSSVGLKERVRAFWRENPRGSKFASAEPGTRRFYEMVEAHRYATEWQILHASHCHLLPMPLEVRLARRWGWRLWIYADK
jgi:hypothetical protein